MKVFIKGLDKAQVLKALFDEALPNFGTGNHSKDNKKISVSKAQSIIDEGPYFTSVGDRLLNVNLSGDAFDPWLYDLVNGEGAAEYAVAGLRMGNVTT